MNQYKCPVNCPRLFSVLAINSFRDVVVITLYTVMIKQLLSSIPIPLKVKPQLENIVLKLAAKAMTMRILPLAVDNLEGNILQLG